MGLLILLYVAGALLGLCSYKLYRQIKINKDLSKVLNRTSDNVIILQDILAKIEDTYNIDVQKLIDNYMEDYNECSR